MFKGVIMKRLSPSTEQKTMELFCYLKRMASKHWQRQKQAHTGKKWCFIIYPPAIGITLALDFLALVIADARGLFPLCCQGTKTLVFAIYPVSAVTELQQLAWLEVLVAQKSFSSAAMLLCSRASACWVEGSKPPVAAWPLWNLCSSSQGW